MKFKLQTRKEWYGLKKSRQAAREALEVIVEFAEMAKARWLQARTMAASYHVLTDGNIQNEEEQEKRVEDLIKARSDLEWKIYQLEFPMSTIETLVSCFSFWLANRQKTVQIFRYIDGIFLEIVILVKKARLEWMDFNGEMDPSISRLEHDEQPTHEPNWLKRALEDLRQSVHLDEIPDANAAIVDTDPAPMLLNKVNADPAPVILESAVHETGPLENEMHDNVLLENAVHGTLVVNGDPYRWFDCDNAEPNNPYLLETFNVLLKNAYISRFRRGYTSFGGVH